MNILELAKEKGFTYNPKTGIVTTNKGTISKPDKRGYIRCGFRIGDKSYRFYAHRFAWYYMTNEIPNIIDHINRDKSDNRFINLRNVTKQENTFNSESKGFYIRKDINKKYRATIGINGKDIHLGYFYTEEEAHQAYLDAKQKHHIIQCL